MSGFEVAGIVLGALPLLIEALKAGKEVTSKFDIVARKDQYLKRYITKLSWHQISLTESIQSIERYACVDGDSGEALDNLEANYETLVATIGRQRWNAFIENVKDAANIYGELVVLFDGLFPQDVTLLRNDPHLLRHLIDMHESWSEQILTQKRRRLKFLTRRTDIMQRLNDLDDTIDTIAKLAKMSTSPHSATTAASRETHSSSKKKAQFNSLERIQRAAAHLFAVIAKTIPGVCSSHSWHSVRLYLESHTDRQRFSTDETKSPTFSVEISGIGTDQTSSIHHRGRITVFDCVGEPQVLSTAVPQVLAPSSQGRRVQFSTPTPQQSHIAPASSIEEITTICRSLANTQSSIDLHLTPTGALRCLRASAPSPTTTSKKSVALAEILTRCSIPGAAERTWTLCERTTFAFVLASTILQLSTAGCIPQSFSAQQIQFHVNDKAVLGTPPFDTTQPFLENVHPPSILQASQPFAKQWTLDLAILLLELWDGRSLSRWATKRGLNDATTDHGTRFHAAQKWFQELEPKIMPPYNLAVARCIEFSGLEIHSWEGKQFRERFCTEVIHPLDEFTKGSRDTPW